MTHDPKTTLPPKALEKEFVYNLQQQVYFLELQGKLLREKMTESKQQKSRGVEANPLFDCQLDESLPLTQLFEKLKMHFATQIQDHKKQNEEMKKQVDDQKQIIIEQTTKLEELTAYKANTSVILEKEKQRLADIIKQQQLELEQQRQLTEKQLLTLQTNQKLLDENTVTIQRQQEEVYTVNQQLRQTQQEAQAAKTNVLQNDQLQNALSKAQIETKELQKQLSSQQLELQSATQRYTQAENERFTANQALELAKMENKNLTNSVAMLQQESQFSAKQIAQLKNTNQQQSEDLKTARLKIESLNQFNNDMQTMIAAMNDKRKFDVLQQKCDRTQKSLEEEVQKAGALEGRIMELEGVITKLNSTVQKLQDKIKQDTDQLCQKLAEYNSTQILSAEQTTEYAQMKQNLEETLKLNEQLMAKVHYLESELQLKQDLSQVQFEEFQTLRKSNEQLTKTLAGLQDRFNTVRAAGDRMREVGAK